VLNDIVVIKDQIAWSWKQGEAFSAADLGTQGQTTYALCIYDSTAGAYDLATSLDVFPNYSWRYRDESWVYLDDHGNQDGVVRLKVKSGAQGKTSVQMRAEAGGLPLPTPHSGSEFFDQDPTVRAQLVALVAGEVVTCWTSDFAPEQNLRNKSTWFAAKSY
jgi:hypothetical protein